VDEQNVSIDFGKIYTGKEPIEVMPPTISAMRASWSRNRSELHTRYVSVLKWLTPFLFAYDACLFMVKVPWREALRSLVVPSVHWARIT
jgi:hypothetical protein